MSDTPQVQPATQNTRPLVGTQPEVVSVKVTGANITTGVASANVAIPKCSNGDMPNRVRIAANASAYVRLGTTNAVVAVAGDLMVQPGDAVIVDAMGFSWVAALQVTGTGAVQITPLEN